MKIEKLLKMFIHNLGNILRSLKASYYRINGIKIGKNTMISLGAKLDVRRGRIIIGDNCTITYGCILVSHDAAASMLDQNDTGEGTIIIEDNAYIGVGSIILRNVRVGKNAIVGSGSVITKDVSAYTVVVGNPQRIVRTINFL